MTLTSLFSKQTDARLDSLREVCRQNQADREWSGSFGIRAKLLEQAAHEAEFAMRKDPSPESVACYLKSRIKAEAECPGLASVEPMISEVCTERLEARTRPALRAGLECLVERLEQEQSAVIARDRQSASEFGLEQHACESPVLGRISAALKEAQGFLARIDDLNFAQMGAPIRACIGEV